MAEGLSKDTCCIPEQAAVHTYFNGDGDIVIAQPNEHGLDGFVAVIVRPDNVEHLINALYRLKSQHDEAEDE